MEDIKAMTELMRQSVEIQNNYNEKNKETKEEMLKKSREKIYAYFAEVLESVPFSMMNIPLTDHLELFIRKEYHESLKAEKYSKEVIATNFAVLKFGTKGYPSYLAVNENHIGAYWHDNRPLAEMTEKVILEVVQNFDMIKHKIQNQLMESIQKRIEENAKALAKEDEANKALKQFVNM